MFGWLRFDAAVASGFAAAVVEPTASYTLCGECVAVIHDARRGELRALRLLTVEHRWPMQTNVYWL